MATTTQQRPAKTPVADASALPLFYKKPVALTALRHGSKTFKPAGDASFAANVNSVPIHIGEFALIARHYPIVFTETKSPVALAVLGLENNVNLFVGENGKWKEDTYVPAYVRRYPFILMNDPAQNKLSLCIDEECGMIGKGEGTPFFVDGQASEAMRQALAFCDEYRAMMDVTREFGEELQKDGLLVGKVVEIAPPGGAKHRLNKFQMVDEAKFDALPDARVLEYRKRKFLHLIYLHLASTNNWPRLGDMSARRR